MKNRECRWSIASNSVILHSSFCLRRMLPPRRTRLSDSTEAGSPCSSSRTTRQLATSLGDARRGDRHLSRAPAAAPASARSPSRRTVGASDRWAGRGAGVGARGRVSRDTPHRACRGVARAPMREIRWTSCATSSRISPCTSVSATCRRAGSTRATRAMPRREWGREEVSRRTSRWRSAGCRHFEELEDSFGGGSSTAQAAYALSYRAVAELSRARSDTRARAVLRPTGARRARWSARCARRSASRWPISSAAGVSARDAGMARSPCSAISRSARFCCSFIVGPFYVMRRRRDRASIGRDARQTEAAAERAEQSALDERSCGDGRGAPGRSSSVLIESVTFDGNRHVDTVLRDGYSYLPHDRSRSSEVARVAAYSGGASPCSPSWRVTPILRVAVKRSHRSCSWLATVCLFPLRFCAHSERSINSSFDLKDARELSSDDGLIGVALRANSSVG